MSDEDGSRSWLEKLSLALNGEPSSRSELLDLLRSAQRRELLDSEALRIIEGALSVHDMQVREIMIPRAQVVFVRLDQDPEEFLPVVIGSGHSRFPVIGENQDEIVGILLAKDLLPLAQKNSKQKLTCAIVLDGQPLFLKANDWMCYCRSFELPVITLPLSMTSTVELVAS